jgi:transposase
MVDPLDVTIIKPYQRRMLGLVNSLKPMLETIKAYDTEITTVFEQHQDRDIFASFPGAGDILAPRLLAAFGSDRNAFSSADEVNRCVGIAPVVERSGKKTWMYWRFKCSSIFTPNVRRVG